MVYQKKKKMWLSPTGIESSKRCPRCFWLRYRKRLYQPEGIVSRLANRYDTLIKKYFDLYRPLRELPPLVKGQVEGVLQDPFQEAYFYHYDDNYGLMGKLDECLVTRTGTFTPVDHKTSSSDPTAKPLIPAYQTQLDTYALLLEKNRRKSSGIGHLIFFYPGDGDKLHEHFPMEVSIVTLKTNPQRAFTEFLRAVQILESPMPKPHADCPFCNWHAEVSQYVKPKRTRAKKQEKVI